MPDEPRERNFGEQPLALVLAAQGLRTQDVVAARPDLLLTHKMVARACKGRWLTVHSRQKVQAALEGATGQRFATSDLFNYR